MRRAIMALVVLTLLPLQVFAGDPWDNYDKGLMAAAIAVNIADGLTTCRVIRRGGCERNTFMPEYPSNNRVAVSVIVCTIMQYFIADSLPPKWRKVFLAGTIAMELNYVRHNYLLCRLKF